MSLPGDRNHSTAAICQPWYNNFFNLVCCIRLQVEDIFKNKTTLQPQNYYIYTIKYIQRDH